MEALKQHIDSGGDDTSKAEELPYPRWVRINTLRTQLEDELETTFKGFEQVTTINGVRKRGIKAFYIDEHVPNLIAIPPSVDLTKTDSYANGSIIFQDKASCFPAYLLDPLPEDGDIMDTCAAPGNKTTHIAAILVSHTPDPDNCPQKIHAFEKNKMRADTLKKMVHLADSQKLTQIHAGQDFLKVDQNSQVYQNVGALLLDPSCSGSGIVGRDDMPELHLPSLKSAPTPSTNPRNKKKPKPEAPKDLKRKREAEKEDEPLETMVDDDGLVTAVTPGEELQNRLAALSAFQLSLLLHAFAFPSARKVTYSTCSIHAEENESVVLQALNSPIAKERGWRIMKRQQQVSGMKRWPVRGSLEACNGNEVIKDACIRASKGDEHGTMGFFLAGFMRDGSKDAAEIEAGVMRDEKGHIVRDLMGIPLHAETQDNLDNVEHEEVAQEDKKWGGFEENAKEVKTTVVTAAQEAKAKIKTGKKVALPAQETEVKTKEKTKPPEKVTGPRTSLISGKGAKKRKGKK